MSIQTEACVTVDSILVLVHVTKKDEVLYSLPVCFIEELFAYSLLCLLLLHARGRYSFKADV